ncbi:UNVERIFIED_CONTAM: hypothetical protein PYX00_003771 [Menopon gallinae]|uniref:Uncharacterized protein n=1 Tax=Menopon gallinae TaxID=328185 RepID=A0AAW2I195_9NEOP
MKFACDQLRYLGVLEAIVLVVMMIWTSTYFVPFMYNAVVHYDAVENLTLPIVGYIPFNYSVTPRYQTAVAFQVIWFYFNNLKTVAIDYFILGYIALHIIQFRYLDLILGRMTQNLVGNDPDVGRINLNLIRWIKQHQEMTRISKVTKEMLSIYFLIEFAYIVVHICVPAFVITSTLSWNLNQKIVLIFICSIGAATLYLLSLSGDILSDSNEEFGITFYGPHLMDNKSSKIIYHMLVNIGRNKSNQLGFSNVFPLCSITFGAIMRMAMSAYLALNQIKAFKN